MNTYRIEAMTAKDYANYMGGGYDYTVKEIDIDAENAAQAIEIAKEKNPNLILNEKCVRTVEEIEAKEKARREQRELEEKKEKERIAKAKATREQNELRKATELGLTVEKYKEQVKLEQKRKMVQKEIDRLKKELEAAEKRLAMLY
jgi:hypothetical protein